MWDAIGSISQVIAALAAFGALAAAVIAAKHTEKLLQTESARDDAAARQLREQHATAVACWPAVIVEAEPDGSELENHRYGVAIRNASNTVIYDVSISVLGTKGASRKPITLTALPPETYFVEEEPRKFGWEFAKPVSEFAAKVRPLTKGENRVVEELVFRDSANVRWRRAGDGLLECLDDVS